MPGAGGNSFTNNPVWDLVVHPAASDVGRGLPALLKLVGRTDYTPPALEVCVDETTPNPTDDGGGTWATLLTGLSGFASFTPTITANGGDPAIDPTVATEAGYVRLGPIVVAWWYIQFGAAMTPGSGLWHLVKPVNSAGGASGNWGVGAGLIVDNSTGATEFVILENRAAADMYLTYGGGTVSDNAPWAWAASDEIRVFAIYPAA